MIGAINGILRRRPIREVPRTSTVSIPPRPEDSRKGSPQGVAEHVIGVRKCQVLPASRGRQDHLEHDCPNQQGDDDLVRQRRSVVASQREFAVGPEHDRDPEGDADQVVEVGSDNRMADAAVLQDAVQPIDGEAEEKERVLEVSERHWSMPRL